MASKSELALKWPVWRPRGWGQPGRSHALAAPWWGTDTERDSKTGEFVCGWNVGQKTERFNSLTDFRPGTHFVWNLAYDIEGIIRDLDLEEGWAAKEDGAPFEILGGRAVYYHGKRFDLKKDGHRITFIEASSFFGRCPLGDVGAKDHMNAKTMSLKKYKANAYYERERKEGDKWVPSGEYGYYADDVDSYCQQDARIVYNAVLELDRGVRSLGVDLGSTPGATARRFMARLGPFPKVLWDTQRPFLRSYCGGRFEITKRGIFHDVRQYDLVSAYPWALAQCPWLTSTAVSRTTRRFNPDALYGTYLVKFRYDDYLGVAPRWHKGVRVYSSAQEETWLARPEVDWLIRNGADLEILRGVEVSDPNATDLWQQVISELFRMKAEGNECFQKTRQKCHVPKCADCKKKTPEGLGAKIILNSQYGVLIQLVRCSGEWLPILEAKNPVDFAGSLALEAAPEEFEGGKYYAPLYAGDLTSRVRCRILDAGKAVGPAAYIGGHTDSALTMRAFPDWMISDELGGWKLEKAVPRAEVCKTGMYAIGSTVKVRGITRKGTAALLWEPTHIRNKRTGIKSATNWNQVSVIAPVPVANNFHLEQKRHWFGEMNAELLARNEFIDSEALAYV
ncbi:MAG: hypothetical protein ACYC0F_18045 [Rhodanobacter sp.]